MWYLTGGISPQHHHLYRSGKLGVLNTPRSSNNLDVVAVWAMDNGAFSGNYPGDEEYLAMLERLLPHADRCLFVAVPDIVYDAEATLRNYPVMAARIKALGYPVALVGQDGMEHLRVPWDQVDWLFVGGSTEWKLGAGGRELIVEAIGRGKYVHVGRVNSHKRFRWARLMGADSVDGNYLGFGPDVNLPSLLSWVASQDQLTIG